MGIADILIVAIVAAGFAAAVRRGIKDAKSGCSFCGRCGKGHH